MGYLTISLENEVHDFWRTKIAQAEKQLRLFSSGKDVRDYLNDRQTLCTPGFIIRRFLQLNYTDLLELVRTRCGCDYTDLTKERNIKWPETFNLDLAPELYRISKENGIRLSSKTWRSYLDDEPIRMYKSSPFKVAFSLKMDTKTTEELLMASGQETYCFRNPEHFIYYYCQRRPGAYSWEHAQDLIARWKNSLGDDVFTAKDSSKGKTFALSEDLHRFFTEPEDNEAADAALIDYMLLNKQEFTGASLTVRDDFLRMTKYLAVLYPNYSKVIRKKNPDSGYYEEVSSDIPVTIDPEGMPRLNELVRAIFNTGGWLSTAIGKDLSAGDSWKIKTASSIRRREANDNIEYKRASIDVEADKPFLNSVQFFVDSYAHHLYAIERTYHHPENAENVDRRDIILLTYFFIRRYPSLLIDEDLYAESLDKLTSLVYENERLDACMDHLMEGLYAASCAKAANKDLSSTRAGFSSNQYIDLFNGVLDHFGMKQIYMPDPFDRFIIMSLFAEDPDLFTEAVLWNTTEESEDPAPAEMTDPASLTGPELSAATTSVPAPVARTIYIPDPSPAPYSGSVPASMALQTDSLPTTTSLKNSIRATLLREVANETIPITKCSFILGRRSTNPGNLQDYGIDTKEKAISRCHIAILFSEGTWYLADISSRQETRLNGVHIKGSRLHIDADDGQTFDHAYVLNSGDRIQIGEEVLLFLPQQ